MELERLLDKISSYNPDADLELLRSCYNYGKKTHSKQFRKSGEPYFTHCVNVAELLADLKLDIYSICAGLLHDTIEDLPHITRSTIADHFGNTIADLVDGVTKLSRYEFRRNAKQRRQAENYLKLLLATAEDIRVILIKLADRLHNMMTLDFQKPESRQRIAKETLEVYAPIAHRLGMAHMKGRLEDLSFKHIDPEEYQSIARSLAEKLGTREDYSKKMVKAIKHELDQNGIDSFVYGRPKHIYSIHKKVTEKGVAFDEICDLIALRVLVDEESECYSSICTIHKKWNHIPERLKDFIGLPKANGYRSLHTTILDKRRRVEIQIRTHEMHKIAENGIAAHWSYKEGTPSTAEGQDICVRLRDMLEIIRESSDPKEFIRSMKGELFADEVFVFTPKGDLHELPLGSTPIDFAYRIHTDVGHSCCGAEVNGAIVPLKYQLQNGDQVNIITSRHAHPGRDWLRWIRTARARHKIKVWFRERDRTEAIEVGKHILELELRKHNLDLRSIFRSPEMSHRLKKLKLQTTDQLLQQIGTARESATHIISMFAPTAQPQPEPQQPEKSPDTFQSLPAIEVDGIDLDAARIMKCCNPIPGDEIIGYITRGRGISIHKANCTRIIENEPERLVHIEWKSIERNTFPVCIVVECHDRPGMLKEITTAITQFKVNIREGKFGKTEDLKTNKNMIPTAPAYDRMILEVTDLNQLEKVMSNVRRIKGVTRVRRD